MADIIVEARLVAKALQPHWFVWLADQQILPEEQGQAMRVWERLN